MKIKSYILQYMQYKSMYNKIRIRISVEIFLSKPKITTLKNKYFVKTKNISAEILILSLLYYES